MTHVKKLSTRYALLPVATAAFLMAGQAQSTGDMQSHQQTSATQTMGAGPAQQAQQTKANYRAMRASEVIGADVRNAQGNNVGEIQDLIVHPQTGKVRYAVMSVDPGWFQSEKLYSVPPKMLRWGQERNDIVLNNVTRQQLEQGGIERSEWNPQFLGDTQRTARLDRAWGESMQPQQQAGGSQLMRASDLIGKTVQGRGGENVGQIEELVLNTSRGEVHYAVMSFDQGWLQAEKRAAVPLRAVQVASGGQLTLNMDKQQVTQMRDFNQQQYTNLNDQQFVREVDRQVTGQRATVRTSQGSGAVQPETRTMGAGLDTQPGSTQMPAPAADRG